MPAIVIVVGRTVCDSEGKDKSYWKVYDIFTIKR